MRKVVFLLALVMLGSLWWGCFDYSVERGRFLFLRIYHGQNLKIRCMKHLAGVLHMSMNCIKTSSNKYNLGKEPS